MICRTCDDDKLEEEFHFKNKKTGLRNKQCKNCSSLYRKKYYSENKESAILYALKSNVDIRLRNRQYVWDYLKKHPCIDCGNDNPIVLDFDHKDNSNKICDIGVAADSNWSLRKIQIEIDKCNIRCSNCHRIRTAIQFNWYKSIIK